MGMNPMVESVKNHPKNKDNIINLNPSLLNPLSVGVWTNKHLLRRPFPIPTHNGIWGMLED